MKKIKYYNLKLLPLLLASSFALTSCGESTYIPDATAIYDTIDSNAEGDVSIEPQVLDIPGEDFKLVVNYSIDGDEDKKWRITSDKDLYIEAHTIGLEEGTRVWIDNVHIDTFIVSTKKEFNGIKQDSMDDRIHTSLLTGFPISDTMSYSSINLIEGQNDEFITGTFYGYSASSSTGSITQRRYTDEDYLKKGVYANKIGLVFGLLIQGPNDPEPYGVDVKSDIVVLVYNRVEKREGDTINVYEYDRDGNYTLVESYTIEDEKKLTLE